jgi:hypothetical protein
MAANALFITTILMMALALAALQACQFLSPYRTLIVTRYGVVLLLFAAGFFLNLFAAIYTLSRKLFLKDTGRKLAHLERQLRAGDGVAEDLSTWLKE